MITHRLIVFSRKGVLISDSKHNTERELWKRAEETFHKDKGLRADYRLETYVGDKLVESIYQGEIVWCEKHRQPKRNPYA
jgi:hypothetical protein